MELGRAPESISLAAVVRAMDGPAQPEQCVLGLRACSDECPCALHHEWIPIRAAIQRLLEETTLDTLAHGLRKQIDLGEKTWVHVGDEAVQSRCTPSRTRKAS
jgi:DNA-binding IscR family transcriptional regulator